MNLLVNIFYPFFSFLKKLVNLLEIKRYKEALRRNPQDHYLRARFAKYCLNSYFQDSNSKTHVLEAVNQFENIVQTDVLDLEVFYLMGKFYQGQDNQKSMEVYKKGIRRYNDFVTKSLDFRHEQVETAFAIALNLLALESNNADPELEKFFKTIKRTYLKKFLDHKVNFNSEIIDQNTGHTPQID